MNNSLASRQWFKAALSALLAVVLVVGLMPAFPVSRAYAEELDEPGVPTESTYEEMSTLAEDIGISTLADATEKRLLRGSFEGYKVTNSSGRYEQPTSDKLQPWKTTATDNRIEIFTVKSRGDKLHFETGTFDPNDEASVASLIPDGNNAAELNATEESSLYQVVNTVPDTVYRWGLDHRGRKGVDSMALVIGPNQSVAPSKNYGNGYDRDGNYYVNNKTYGKDQFMQMVNWAKGQNLFDTGSYHQGGRYYSVSPTEYWAVFDEDCYDRLVGKEPKEYTIYSKKFAADGGFVENADGQPFSLTPTETYTEEWHVWIFVSDNKEWRSYGANDPSLNFLNTGGNMDAETLADNGNYFYDVPSDQDETLFAFVSVDSAGAHMLKTSSDGSLYEKGDMTVGNLMDKVNFELYSSANITSSPNGSACAHEVSADVNMGTNPGAVEVAASSTAHIYVEEGTDQALTGLVRAIDTARVNFAGVAVTKRLDDKTTKTELIPVLNNTVALSSITGWKTYTGTANTEVATVTVGGKQKNVYRVTTDSGYYYNGDEGFFLERLDENNNEYYTTFLNDVEYAFDAQFVFLMSPTVAYDTDGGDAYKIAPTSDTNIYDFSPTVMGQTTTYVEPYTSHVPEAADGWRFLGWYVVCDSEVAQKDGATVLLQGTNTVACNYSNDAGTQHFVLINGENTFTTEGASPTGQTWTTTSTIAYECDATGLVLVSLWNWRQRVISQVDDGSGWVQSSAGGTVTLSGSMGANAPAIVSEDTPVKEYYAYAGEKVTATATAAAGYRFVGWYDGSGEDAELLSNAATYTYDEVKYEVNDVYARFLPLKTQTFIRQIQDAESSQWVGADDTVATLSSYSITSAADGDQVACSVAPTTNYRFVGWYDENGNAVPASMLSGTTLVYNVEGDATYYARFADCYVIKFEAWYYNGGVFKKCPTSGNNSGNKGAVENSEVKYTDDDTFVTGKAELCANYKFYGWYTTSNVAIGDKALSTSQSLEVAVNGESTNGATYYAMYVEKKPTATFNTARYNGTTYEAEKIEGQLSPTSQQVTTANKATSTVTPPRGYVLEGWYPSLNDAKNGTNKLGTSTTFTTPALYCSATYYARLDYATQVNVTFAAQTASGNYASATIADSTTGGTVALDESALAPISSTAFTPEGASEPTGVTAAFYDGETITAVATKKTGYTFMGWYDAAGNLQTGTKAFTVVASDGATYYARYMPTQSVNAVLTLNDNIDVGIRIYPSTTSNFVDPDQLSVTYGFAGTEPTTVSYKGGGILKTTINGRECYTLVVAKVQPWLMGDKVTFTVNFAEGYSALYTYSVQQYCNSTKKATSDFTPEAVSRLNELCAATLTYGAWTQNYKGDDPSAFVVPVDENTLPTVPETKATFDASADVTAASGTLILGSETSLKFYLTAPNGLSESDVAVVDDAQNTVAISDFAIENDGRYSFKITNIGASRLSRMYTVSAKGASITYGPYCYLYSKTTSADADQNLKNLCKAIYAYGEAARLYNLALTNG